MTYFWHSCNLSNCHGDFQRLGSRQWRLGAVLIGILGFAGVEWGTG